jgi:hypothetical protein
MAPYQWRTAIFSVPNSSTAGTNARVTRIGALGVGEAAAEADTTWKKTQQSGPDVENPAAASGTPESNGTGARSGRQFL